MVIIEIMLMPAAVLAAIINGSRSRPSRSNAVSRSKEEVMPEATGKVSRDRIKRSLEHLTRDEHYGFDAQARVMGLEVPHCREISDGTSY